MHNDSTHTKQDTVFGSVLNHLRNFSVHFEAYLIQVLDKPLQKILPVTLNFNRVLTVFTTYKLTKSCFVVLNAQKTLFLLTACKSKYI